MADARETYYEALQNKRIRDARNPVMDAASAGWATGLAKGANDVSANEALANKANLEIGLAKMKQRQEMASKIIETHNIYKDGVLDNTPGTKSLAYDALVSGDDKSGLTFMPMKEQRTYQTEGEKMKELIALGQDPATLAKLKGKEPKYTAKQVTKNPDGTTLTQEGTTVQQAIPGQPAVPAKRIFNVPIPFTGSDAVPASTGDVFVPAGQQPPDAQQPPTAQPAAMPAPVVKAIGNAALKAHYAHSAVNPQTGARIYSDDGVAWFDEAGNPLQ
jgi:hypothetical protein